MRARTFAMPSMAMAALSLLLLVAATLLTAIPAAGNLSLDADPPSLHSTAGSTGKGSGPAAKPVKVRVMTFNIRHGTDEEGDLDLESVADDIESAEAQIVGLQEVDRHRSARSDFVDQAKWLAKRLDMHFAFGLNRKTPPQRGHKKPGLHGVAVLSKFPIVTARNHMLTNLKYKHRPTKQRSMLEVVIDVKGTKISFYNTHLDNQRSEQRVAQMKEILAITGQSGRPSILVGDFNAQPASQVVGLALTQFRDVMADLGDDDELTFPYDEPDRRIDYIMVRGPVSARWGEVIDTGSSDHMPVLAGLTIIPPAKKASLPPSRVEGGPRPRPAAAPPVPPGPARTAAPVWF